MRISFWVGRLLKYKAHTAQETAPCVTVRGDHATSDTNIQGELLHPFKSRAEFIGFGGPGANKIRGRYRKKSNLC
jgi:hypothetical protein